MMNPVPTTRERPTWVPRKRGGQQPLALGAASLPTRCRRCGRVLRSEAAVAAGIGPTCAKVELQEGVKAPEVLA